MIDAPPRGKGLRQERGLAFVDQFPRVRVEVCHVEGAVVLPNDVLPCRVCVSVSLRWASST